MRGSVRPDGHDYQPGDQGAYLHSPVVQHVIEEFVAFIVLGVRDGGSDPLLNLVLWIDNFLRAAEGGLSQRRPERAFAWMYQQEPY